MFQYKLKSVSVNPYKKRKINDIFEDMKASDTASIQGRGFRVGPANSSNVSKKTKLLKQKKQKIDDVRI